MLPENNPNIAVFSFAFSPLEGGAEIATRETSRRLKWLNFAIFTHKFNRGWLTKEVSDNIEIIRIGKGRKKEKLYCGIWTKIFYIFKAWQSAEQLHKQKRFQVIWAIMTSYGGIAALFFKLNHPRIPLLVTIQEGDSEKHLILGKLGLVGFFGKRIIRTANYIQVISSYLKDFAKKRGAKARIDIIPNGVDLKVFDTQYTNEELRMVRGSLGLKDEYVVITTSRLVYKNGIDVLISAIARCQEKMLNVKCLIIGDGPEREKLKVQSQKLKIDNKIIFLGQIPQRDLPLYLKISDVFVRPSRSEGLGNSFLEAMAAGLPIIGTPVGGIVDFLISNETGLYTNVDDANDLADKIHKLLTSPESRGRLINNGKKMVRENYSWDIVAKHFKNIFDTLINTHG